MSDLRRAVAAEIQAFTPDRTPPLAALKASRRSRDRRHAVAGAALSVVAVVGAFALGPGLLNGPPDTARSVVGGSALTDVGGPVAFDVGPASLDRVEDPLFGVGVDACVRLPGTSNLIEFMSLPAKYQVTVTGSDAIDAFTSCIDGVVGYTVTAGTAIVLDDEEAIAARLCSDAAKELGGQVVGAYPTTVAAVRAYMQAPPTTGGTLAAPDPNGASAFPPNWSVDALNPKTSAAACYLDGSFPTPGPPGNGPAERALVMAATGASPFLAAAGPRDSLEPVPLPPAS